ncbi:MAG: hypothetical protein EOO99_11890 [Pedobacter sp.]|nr:MAG: hypothetical protein EOO99_11890 [Pedobacter sp.]
MSAIKLGAKLVKPSFHLVMKQEHKNLVDYILDELKGLDISQLKLDPDFLKYLAEIIENQVKQPKGDGDKTCKPNKMDILIDVVKRLFPHASEMEIDACKGIVEFLLKNTLIKKTSLSKIMSFYLKKKFCMRV